MIFNELSLKGAYTIDLKVFSDDRGWFARTYCKEEFSKIGIGQEWVQMNHSFTAKNGTIRGMHFQFPPYGEVKMVRCIAGVVNDVIVDLRKDSVTYLQYESVELSAANRRMIYIPQGFAHGFQTLTDNAELIYHHSALYNPKAEGGLLYNDAAIGIEWALQPTELSERDRNHPIIDV
jgi:dTDP-4-dehydrorhamnose 3,5-epimerase